MTNRCNQSKGSDPQDGPAVRNTKFCLCGRDPSSAEVRKELIKAMALSLRYDLVQGGCLENAAAAFDKIFANLVPDEARNLERAHAGHRRLAGRTIGEIGFFRKGRVPQGMAALRRPSG